MTDDHRCPVCEVQRRPDVEFVTLRGDGKVMGQSVKKSPERQP